MTKNPNKLTANQHLVLDALKQAKRPLGAYFLLDQLRGTGLNSPTQIYRALNRLIERGVAHRLETLNAFVACSHLRDCTHHNVAFAICYTCGNVEEFVDDDLKCSLKRWAQSHDFSIGGSAIEIGGQCAGCTAFEALRDQRNEANEKRGFRKHV